MSEFYPITVFHKNVSENEKIMFFITHEISLWLMKNTNSYKIKRFNEYNLLNWTYLFTIECFSTNLIIDVTTCQISTFREKVQRTGQIFCEILNDYIVIHVHFGLFDSIFRLNSITNKNHNVIMKTLNKINDYLRTEDILNETITTRQ